METKSTLWEVFIRSKSGLSHKHVGSVHAGDEVMALNAARDTYTRRNEGVSIWIVPSAKITASDLNNISETLENSDNKIYRHHWIQKCNIYCSKHRPGSSFYREQDISMSIEKCPYHRAN